MVIDQHENLYALVTGLAARASDRKLALLMGTSVCGAAGVLFLVPGLWPLAAWAGTLASIVGWGLLEHRSHSRGGRVLRMAQGALVAAGFALAVVAALALFFASLGPRWVL